MAICTEPGCSAPVPRGRCPVHEKLRQARRNADPRRKARYEGSWPKERAAIIAEEPWCHDPRPDHKGGLTVDHGPNGERTVIFRRHHGMLEARRRAKADEAP